MGIFNIPSTEIIMKFLQMSVALLGAAEAARLGATKDDESHLAQLVTQALAGAPPGEIAEPIINTANDKENDVQVTRGKTVNYEYFWKYACAFTKWTPSNQWLHNQQTQL